MTILLIFVLMGMFICMGIPIAFALGITSLGFLTFVTKVPLIVIVQRLFTGVDSFTLLAVPLFIFVGVLMNSTSISEKIVNLSIALVGHLKGGLSAVNIVASMFFAGISGTAMADTAAIGGLMIPAMIKKGYKADFTAAVTASSSTIGIIIPPSVPMVLYGVFVGISVTKLFIAGIIPGIFIGLGLILVSSIISHREGYGSETTFSFKRLWQTFIEALPALFLPVIILGGIMSGVFTPSEAGSVAVVYILILGFFLYRDLNLKKVYRALKDAVLLTGSVLIIIAVASLLGWIFAYAKIPQTLVSPVLHITKSPIVFMWIASFILIIAGTFLHGTAMLVIIVPLFLPIVSQLGIDPLHFAMVVMICWGIGQQTPPVGSALYITCTLADVDMGELTRANIPFMSILLVILAGVIHLPQFFVFFMLKLFRLM